MWQYNYADELEHHGIKGMKWGVRRYQNKDGSLTPAGRKRYISVAEGKLRAEKHAIDARRETYKRLNNSPKKHSRLQYEVAATVASYGARKKSVIADKEFNRQLRAQKAAEKVAAQSAKTKVGDLQTRKHQITVLEGKLRAEKAATDARRETYKRLNESPQKHSKFQYEVAATVASYGARKKSVIADKDTNRQIRAKKRRED